MKPLTMRVYNGDDLQYEHAFIEPREWFSTYLINWTHIRMFHGKRPIKTIRNRRWSARSFGGVDEFYNAHIAGAAGTERISLRVPWLRYP